MFRCAAVAFGTVVTNDRSITVRPATVKRWSSLLAAAWDRLSLQLARAVGELCWTQMCVVHKHPCGVGRERLDFGTAYTSSTCPGARFPGHRVPRARIRQG